MTSTSGGVSVLHVSGDGSTALELEQLRRIDARALVT